MENKHKQFFLTPEEVEIVYDSLRIDFIFYSRNKGDFEKAEKIKKILNRIKQYQDDNSEK